MGTVLGIQFRTVLGPGIGCANLCRAGPKFWPESEPCFTLSENHFCNFGTSRRVTRLCIFFGNMLLGKCTCLQSRREQSNCGGTSARSRFSCDFQAPKRRSANGLRRRKHRDQPIAVVGYLELVARLHVGGAGKVAADPDQAHAGVGARGQSRCPPRAGSCPPRWSSWSFSSYQRAVPLTRAGFRPSRPRPAASRAPTVARAAASRAAWTCRRLWARGAAVNVSDPSAAARGIQALERP